ncbi:MAG: hypothetical protein ACRDQ5_19045 [Sciscionella sp.]
MGKQLPGVVLERYAAAASLPASIRVSDVVADDHLDLAVRAERGSYVGCIADALTVSGPERLAGRPFPRHRRSRTRGGRGHALVDAGTSRH